MRDSTLESLLVAVRRRLARQRLARALRLAAWTSLAAMVACLLVHAFVRPVAPVNAATAAALPWIVATLWASIRRSSRMDCAAWADRHLAGATAYSTLVEIGTGRGTGPVAPAVQRLVQWVDEAVPRSLELLRRRPLHARLARPVTATLVCGALTAILLQIPARDPASSVNGATAESPATQPTQATPDAAAASTRDTVGVNGDPRDNGAGRPGAGNEPAPGRDTPRNAASTRGPSLAGALDRGASLSSAPESAVGGSRPGDGGHEAGDSADTSTDGLSEAWQGALVAKLRSSAGIPGDGTARTDATRSATYDAPPAQPGDASPAPRIAPAAAVAPGARQAAPLGPAQQAFVRAYFAGSRARP